MTSHNERINIAFGPSRKGASSMIIVWKGHHGHCATKFHLRIP